MNLLLRDELATILAEEFAANSLYSRTELPGMEPIQATPRAKALRRISEIASMRGWQMEVTRTLDRNDVGHVDDLPESEVFALRDRMEYFEDCVQTCCDPDDSPPAR